MVDIVDRQTRARMMSGIRGKNTKPEMVLRRALHARGFRYRLHGNGVPGRPDLILAKHRAVVFVHGCFWHRHEGCRYATTPATRPEFWAEKFAASVRHDRAACDALAELGGRVATVWECALRRPNQVTATCAALVSWLATGAPNIEIGEGDLRHVPLGYDVKDRKLVVNEEEAATVRGIFERFVEVGSATVLARELRRKGLRNKQGTLVDKGYLYRVLVNRVYRGDAVHKGKAYPGEHRAIIDEQLWDQVHAILRQNPRKRANNTRAQAPALLKGLIFTATGAAMTPSSTKKGARRYRYYVSMDVIKNREPSDEGIPRRLPADLVEAAVVTELRRVMRAPSITAQVIAHLAREGHAFAEADVISALQTFEDVWGQLFPAEQTRIVQLLVRRVTVTSEGLVIDVRTDGVSGVMRDMMAPRKKVAAE